MTEPPNTERSVTPESLGLILRVARKQYGCNGDGSASHRHADDCTRIIFPREFYVEYVGDVPAYQSGSRITEECCREFWGFEVYIPRGEKGRLVRRGYRS